MQQPDYLIDYIEKAKLGDEDAFAKIFKETHSMVYNIACASIKNTEEAKDVVSEVYIRVFRHLPTLRDSHSFIRWLTVITHNVCTDHLTDSEGTLSTPLFPEPPGRMTLNCGTKKKPCSRWFSESYISCLNRSSVR
ncbi:MAG: RNA polymerase sigma factor [Clostridia bacterium]|nr:RNA polymerase sigma factor [Clostridia bacterium]